MRSAGFIVLSYYLLPLPLLLKLANILAVWWTISRGLSTERRHAVRALLTVSNKFGITSFANALHHRGCSLLATRDTAELIAQAGTPVSPTEPTDEIHVWIIQRHLASLYRLLHAALVVPYEDRKLAEKEGIVLIDLLCIDLYPIEAVAYDYARTTEETLQEFDTGGSALIDGAVKGKRDILCDPDDRIPYLDWLDAGRPNEDAVVLNMGLKALAYSEMHRAHLKHRLLRELPIPAKIEALRQSDMGQALLFPCAPPEERRISSRPPR
jgi:AICAR transformylase/IMP cyclohydrolase PurH